VNIYLFLINTSSLSTNCLVVMYKSKRTRAKHT